jgi:Dynamin family
VRWDPADGAVGATEIERATHAVLSRAMTRLAEARAPDDVVERLRSLDAQVGEPCVVAVVGRVNAGKSTFINALLGEDRAMVGSAETTATITHFSYGVPDRERPVRCHWRNGSVTDETLAFLESLQGSDTDALRRADGISHLECRLPDPMLERLTLVDTPGLGAAVDAHQQRTSEFLALERDLRRRHDAETRRLAGTADAIVYLVGAVALRDDRDVAEQFGEVTGGGARAMNALGVLAKIDVSEALIARRDELASRIAQQLDSQLNAVVPVSAGLARAHDRMARDGDLARRLAAVAAITPDALDLLLSDEELFCAHEVEGCPLPAAERSWLRHAIAREWRVAATAVAIAAETSGADALAARLRDLAGFDRLRATLARHFLERSHILRCHRIARDAQQELRQLRFSRVARSRDTRAADRPRLERFLTVIADDADPSVAVELREYLRAQLATASGAGRLASTCQELEAEVGTLLLELRAHHDDFAALQDLELVRHEFTAEQLDELRALLGLYGSELDRRLRGVLDHRHWLERQIAWRLLRESAPTGSRRSAIADRAHARLGLVLAALESQPPVSPLSDDRPRRGQGAHA